MYLNFNMYNITQIPFTVKEVRTDESDPDHCMVLLSTSHMVPELLMQTQPLSSNRFYLLYRSEGSCQGQAI